MNGPKTKLPEGRCVVNSTVSRMYKVLDNFMLKPLFLRSQFEKLNCPVYPLLVEGRCIPVSKSLSQ
jgi:hypothetical protein